MCRDGRKHERYGAARGELALTEDARDRLLRDEVPPVPRLPHEARRPVSLTAPQEHGPHATARLRTDPRSS